MLNNFKCHFEHLWRQLEEVATSQRNVLALLPAFSRRADFRVFAIEQRWQICFASTLDRAIEILQTQKIDVVIYDRDLPDADWRRALHRISNCASPAIVIVLSYTTDASAERLVLDCGGYAVARKPVERDNLVPLVNGALQLVEEIDSLRGRTSPSREQAAHRSY